MKMAPLAKLNDGLIDLLIVKKTSRLKLFTLFPQVFSGKHIHSPILQYIQTDYFKVETEQNYLLNIDGEVKGNTPFEVIVHKQKLKVLG
jgi:diacylglycerol kinase family enzyme